MSTIKRQRSKLFSNVLIRPDALKSEYWWDYEDILKIKVMPTFGLCNSLFNVLNSEEIKALSIVTNMRSEQCDICGSVSAHKKMDEWWFFDEEPIQQILVRTLSLCDLCYKCTRYYANKDMQWDLDQHFMIVNNWNDVELKNYLYDTKKNAKLGLDKWKWELDLSWLDYIIVLSDATKAQIQRLNK